MKVPFCIATLALLLGACLPEPKHACSDSKDCLSDRVCVAGLCQDPKRDASPESDGPSPEAAPDGPFPKDAFGELGALDRPSEDAALAGDVLDAVESVEAEPRSSPDLQGHSDTSDPPAPPDVSLDDPTSDDPQADANLDSGGLDHPPPLVDLATDSVELFDVALDRDVDRAECGACAANGWELFDVTLSSGPATAHWGPGDNVGVFWRGADNHLKYIRFSPNEGWSGERDLGGVLASDPSASSRGSDGVDVFWRGTNNHLKHRWYSPSQDDWSKEEDLGGTLASAPASASWDTIALYVFWRGPDGGLKRMAMDYANSNWSAEIDMGTALQGAPAVMFRSYGIMDVFWRGADGDLQHIWSYDAGSWIGVQSLGSSLAAGSSPTATARRDGWIDVLWRGTDDRLKHIAMDLHSQWSPVEDLGGDLDSSPSATSWRVGQLDVFAKDAPTGKLAHRVWRDDSSTAR